MSNQLSIRVCSAVDRWKVAVRSNQAISYTLHCHKVAGLRNEAYGFGMDH